MAIDDFQRGERVKFALGNCNIHHAECWRSWPILILVDVRSSRTTSETVSSYNMDVVGR